jgi:hypothetical protein
MHKFGGSQSRLAQAKSQDCIQKVTKAKRAEAFAQACLANMRL